MIEWFHFQRFHRIRGNRPGEISYFDALSTDRTLQIVGCFCSRSLSLQYFRHGSKPVITSFLRSGLCGPGVFKRNLCCFPQSSRSEQAEVGLADLPDKIQVLIVEGQVCGNKSRLSCANLRTPCTEIHKRISQMDSRIKDAQILLDEGLIEEFWIKISSSRGRCDDGRIQFALCDPDR